MSVLDPLPLPYSKYQSNAANLTAAQQAASDAQVARDAAKTAQGAAESARDVANGSARLFANTTAGLAGTTNGQTFTVMDASGQFWITYQNSSGTAVEVARAYTKAYQDAWLPTLYETLDTTYGANVALILDSAKRIIAKLPDANINAMASSAMSLTVFETLDTSLTGTLVIDSQRRIVFSFAGTLATLASLGASAVTSYYYESLDTTASLYVVDSHSRILSSITSNATISSIQTTLSNAAGSVADLATRLSHGLTPYGDPISPFANVWSLRETRMRLRKRALGESVQLVIALIGDSYTQSPTRYSGPLAKLLQDTYGSAGIGWVSFAWFGGGSGPWTSGSQPTGLDQGARYDLLTVFQIIGTWTCTYNTASTNTPSLSYSTSSTAGDYVRFTVPAGHNACQLFYGGDGTGVVQVSWDDGATWSANITLSTVGAGNLALTGVPSTATTARIKVISGNVSLAGIDLQSTSSGVRVHKLGGSGSAASQWASVTPSVWAAQMQALGSHLHQVMHGTNDQGSGPAPSMFAGRLATIFSNIATVLPYSDKLIVMPPENQRTNNTVTMASLTQGAREYAVANDVAFCDLQYFFGSPANNAYAYAYANPARPWYASDLIHPDPLTGGRAIVDAEYRLLTSS